MKYKRFENEIVVTLDTDENIHDSIKEVCRLENVMMGTVTGFGGVRFLKVGIWNNENNDYDYLIDDKSNMELLNLTGNISLIDGNIHTHIHVTAADNKFRTFGGHLAEGIVQNLMELYIYPGTGRIDRVKYKSWYFMDI